MKRSKNKKGKSIKVKNKFGNTYIPNLFGKTIKDISYSSFFDYLIKPKISDKHTFYLFIGTDSGLLLKTLLKNPLDNTCQYLAIETDDINKILKKYRLISEREMPYISNERDWMHIAESLDVEKYFALNKVKIIKSIALDQHSYQDYERLEQLVKGGFSNLSWKYPDKWQSRAFIQHQILNSPDNHSTALALKNSFKGHSALILAGGPSLDEHIKWIENNQNNHIVISISRISKRLLKTSIVPDIIVTSDPYESAYDTSKEVMAYGSRSILVHHNYANSKLIEEWPGINFYLGELFRWDSEYIPENLTCIGPTVANTAVHLAIQMGIKNQILFGVDLCYSPEGFSHESSSIERLKNPNIGFLDKRIKTYSGLTADTTSNMLQAIQSLSLLGNLAKKQGGAIINPSKNAAKVENITYCPIDAQTLKKALGNSKSQLMEVIKDESKTNFHAHYSKVLTEIEFKRNQTKSLFLLIDQWIKLNNVYIHSKNYMAIDNYAQKSREIEEQIFSNSKLLDLVEPFGGGWHENFIRPTTARDKFNFTSEKQARRYFIILWSATEFFLNLLDLTIKKTKMRIVEVSDCSDIKQLEETWDFLGDKKLFRIPIIKIKNQKLYNQFTDEYICLYKTKYKSLFFGIETPESINIKELINEIDSYFFVHDKAKLENFITKNKNLLIEKDKSLINLTNGYLFELNQEYDNANKEYLKVNGEYTREHALRSYVILNQDNGNYNKSINGLEKLILISPNYLIHLSQIYLLLNKPEKAIDALADFIDHYPKYDFYTYILGELYDKLINNGYNSKIIIDTLNEIINNIISELNFLCPEESYKDNSQSKDIVAKLFHLFNEKDEKGISSLIQKLQDSESSTESLSLIKLGQGHIFEINDNLEAAIDEYSSACHNSTLESSLKRLTEIALKEKNIASALECLTLLSKISDEYFLQLAELQKLSKLYKDALESYSNYIDKHPNDIITLLKIGSLYAFLEVNDGAKFVFNHVLELDPDNETSIYYMSKL